MSNITRNIGHESFGIIIEVYHVLYFIITVLPVPGPPPGSQQTRPQAVDEWGQGSE